MVKTFARDLLGTWFRRSQFVTPVAALSSDHPLVEEYGSLFIETSPKQPSVIDEQVVYSVIPLPCGKNHLKIDRL